MTESKLRTGMKAAYYTLGCKLNFAETSTIGRLLSERGVGKASKDEIPDICVVNTCSVTETADKKGRSLIRRLRRLYPGAKLVVTGCYAQLKPDEVAALEGVDLVLGSKEKHRLADFLDELFDREDKVKVKASAFQTDDSFSPSCARGDRTRFFLKVQDGCDYYCTYCTIPFARGRSRSGSIKQLTELARDVALQGGREIVLTGVNIGDFGKNTGETFFDLIRNLDAVEGIERYRISSIEPNLLSDEIIEWVAGKARAFMPHFHIPLQSGSDTVLKIMNRRYDTALFASKIKRIRELMPDAFIGVDIIAGSRGETAEEWKKSLEFVERLDITRLHVFPYSERSGTAALHLGSVVDKSERFRRADELIRLSNVKHRDFLLRNAGRQAKVLWEHALPGDKLMTGLTENYIRTSAPFDPECLNTLSTLKLTEENMWELKALGK